jgi:DNA-binding NtrC family response regulator
MRAPSPSTSEQVSRIVLLTTDRDAFAEFQQVLTSTLETVLVSSMPQMFAQFNETDVHAVILDLDMIASNMSEAVAELHELRAAQPDLVIVALTRSRNRAERLKARQAGADEFFLAPVDAQELRIVVERAIRERLSEVEDRLLREELVRKYTFGELIGGCEAMQRVYDAVTRVADSNSTVLLRGESGTGKELVAKAIVAHSARHDKPLVSLNCAALPDNLIETELFGHEKGAYTGADSSRAGHVEMADRGTLFLDEISSLGLALQSKLLRVLQDHTVTRVGGKNPRKIDFRLIAATNDDLEKMVKAGQFREDLYYRINVVPISLPPLRERGPDIALLLDHFLRIYCVANGFPSKNIEPEVVEVLEDYPWPGNVRELENLAQRLVLMVSEQTIKLKHLPQSVLQASSSKQDALLIPEEGVSFDQEIARIEIAYLRAALQRTGGKKVAAAALLGIPPQKVKYLCRKYGLNSD